jgi:RNA-directed DNA polymerase
MLNLDLDSFFYQVDTPKVKSILNSYTYFSFNRQTEELLSKLLTYHGRLPMGSPTSPVLSNFATITLDHELLYWTRQANIVYTRYVDDLTFSSDKPITNDHYGKILSILHSHQFSVDPQKTRWYDETMQKEVTGLIVGEKITIPEDYFTEVEMNIRKLENVFEYAQRFPDWQISEWLEKLKQTIGGQIEFIGRVYGKKHSIYRDFSSKLKKAIRNTDIEESISWRYIGYGDF